MLLPNQEIAVLVDRKDGTEVCVEPGLHNDIEWPEPQLKTVKNGKVHICNNKNVPILLGKDVKTLQMRDTIEPEVNHGYYKYTPTNSNISSNNISFIKHGNYQSENVRVTL